jgi:hypothetical protein
LGQQNRPGAGTPQRHTVLRALADRFEQLIHHQQLADRGTFATWDNKTIHKLKMFREAYLQYRRANAPKYFLMFAEIALESENAYCHIL